MKKLITRHKISNYSRHRIQFISNFEDAEVIEITSKNLIDFLDRDGCFYIKTNYNVNDLIYIDFKGYRLLKILRIGKNKVQLMDFITKEKFKIFVDILNQLDFKEFKVKVPS